jgi:hypothetical protein
MRFFYDTEFLERGPEHPLELITLGVVAEDGRELYLANADFDPEHATPWLREHVLPHLPPRSDPVWRHRPEIALELHRFVGEVVPEWWGDCAAYDHVVLCQIFGEMTALPTGWPYFTRDLSQLKEFLGDPALPPFRGRAHHALDDARWIRDAWELLRRLYEDRHSPTSVQARRL